ncbi:BgTH12-00854 [Blumeria graminis f. sp. triticale]|uniref:BgtE-5992 n=3 Tax=Blumeria graminis TaxID=34373 RepID=A0A9X9MMW2_BLUGR|nr:putative secreted effector protein [Blumeria graminis f. sp. tritici 96224]CAD6505363.1 BgTH12-00854 [Blumeria graminis f. sp. triticale]VDB93409.1 BgtE-5992 [Blumeria graminis f. sp. tritici]
MGFIFAFLSTVTKHLAIINLGSQNVMYNTYQSNLHFPTVKSNHEIYFLETEVLNQNTRAAAYFSPQLSSVQILDEIKSSLLDSTKISKLVSFGRDKPEKNCLAKITSLSQRSTNKLSIILGTNDRDQVCTSRIIVGLAFIQTIQILGDYNCFAPQPSHNIINIDADIPLQIEDVVDKNDVVAGTNTGSKTTVLLWYQKHLHLFERDSNYDMTWVPVTKIGHETTNGNVILEFIRPQIFRALLQASKIKNIELYDIILNSLQQSEETSDLSVANRVKNNHEYKDNSFIDGTLLKTLLKGPLC